MQPNMQVVFRVQDEYFLSLRISGENRRFDEKASGEATRSTGYS